MKTFTICHNDAGQRIDKFISKALPNLPKSLMFKLFRKKDIKLNGKRCDISAFLNVGDVVSIYAKDEFLNKEVNLNFLNADFPIDIVFEDDNILIVDKPTEISVHSDSENHHDTMINRILCYLYKNNSYSPANESSFTPALCNRIDKNTSGLIIAAKNAAALREINKAIKSNNVRKKYHCITISPLPNISDTLIAYHKKMDTGNIVKISDKPIDGYKKIITKYTVIKKLNGLNLLEVELITGRTHQIRAHLAHINSPILGDPKYGSLNVNKAHKCFIQTLCAFSLEFSFENDSALAYLNNKIFKCNTPYFETKYF